MDTLDNTGHNLMIVESLGQDHPYLVRAMAQHLVLVYCIALCLLWMASPSFGCKFSKLLETHSVKT